VAPAELERVSQTTKKAIDRTRISHPIMLICLLGQMLTLLSTRDPTDKKYILGGMAMTGVAYAIAAHQSHKIDKI